jgi:hypothetical protein
MAVSPTARRGCSSWLGSGVALEQRHRIAANMGAETRDLATLANITKSPCATGSEPGTLKCKGEATVDHFLLSLLVLPMYDQRA